MVMLRLLHEDPSDATVDAILADWPTVLRHALDRHGEDADQLSALFERLRCAEFRGRELRARHAVSGALPHGSTMRHTMWASTHGTRAGTTG